MALQDSHTAKFLFERLLKGALLRNRTVVSSGNPYLPLFVVLNVHQVLVTHHVELVLPGAYYYVEMHEGRVHLQGIVHELRQRGILEDWQPELIAEEPEDEGTEDDIDRSTSQVATDVAATKTLRKNPKQPRRLVEDEAREIGGVKWIIYDTYLRAS